MVFDFAKFEEEIIEQFKASLHDTESGTTNLALTIGKISARVATIAIQEYHRALNDVEDGH